MNKTRFLMCLVVVSLSLALVGMALASDGLPRSTPPSGGKSSDGITSVQAGITGVNTDYTWSQVFGTYTEITGGTQVTASCDDTSFDNITVPFSFTFNDVAYASLSIQCNGFIALGTSVSSSYTPISTGSSDNIISGLGGDLQTNTTDSEIRYEVLGTTPDQVFVIQWKNFRHYAATGDLYNYQIRLYETSNLVEVVYGSFTQNVTDRTSEVGLRGDSNSDFNNRLSTAEWINSVAGTFNNDSMSLTTVFVPSSGLIWDWAPPPPHPVFDTSSKTAPDMIESEEPINYTIAIHNTGNIPGLNTSMVDPIPVSTAYNGDVTCSAGDCMFDGSNILWSGQVDMPPLPNTITVTFSVTPYLLGCGDLVINEAVIDDPEAIVPVNVSATTALVNTVYYDQHFEDSDGGYYNAGVNPWSWGPPPPALAPAHSGENVWATESPYVASGDYQLFSSLIDLTSVNPGFDLVLNWWQKLDVEVGYDYAYVDVSTDGITWVNLWTGNYHGNWENISADITPYTGQSIQLRFHMTSDSSVQYNGWAIDDVVIHNGCQNLQVPDIDVTPPFLAQTQTPDVVETVPLTISNVGLETLTWSIDEAESFSVLPYTPSQVDLPDGYALSHDNSFKVSAQSETMKKINPNLLALINDGSFENGPPPASAWTEVSDQLCEWIGNWGSVWGVPAFDGINDYWSGGYCGGIPTTSNVHQVISVPSSNPTLSFWYIAYRPDVDDADLDYAYLSVDGTPVWTLDLIQANNTYPNFVNVTLDLSAWAGLDVTLEFGGVSAGASTGNIRYDFIEWMGPAACTSPIDIPWLSVVPGTGDTLPGDDSLVDVFFDSTGLSIGTYSANLCVNSNDPNEPLVVVPVTLDVVEGGIPDITVDPLSLDATLSPDEQQTQQLNACNVGDAPLDWTLTEVPGLQYIGKNVTIHVPPSEIKMSAVSRADPKALPARDLTLHVDLVSTVDIDVLIVTPDIAGGFDINLLLSTLAAFPDLIVTVWDGTAGTPTVADMQAHDVVFVGNDILWTSSSIDKTVLSNNLADYIDAGGNVLAGSFIWSYDDWGLGGGRFITEDYSPFEISTTDIWAPASLGTFDPTHPIMDGITTVTDNVNHQNQVLSSTGVWVASWDDGENFVAVSPNVVGLNQLYFYSADFGGQAGELLHNALLYLSVPAFDIPWLSENPTSGTVQAGDCTLIDVIFDSTGLTQGTYTGSLDINSNDPDEPTVNVPVTLTVEVTSAPIIVVSPPTLDAQLLLDQSTTLPMTITNEGNADLTWELFDGIPSPGWSDNFDSYDTGSQMHGQGGWQGWDNNPAAGALTSDVQSLSTPNSVAILGASDLTHPYSGYTTGAWTYTAWQFIPTDFSGVTYFILLNTYTDGGPYNWSLEVSFDSSTGLVTNDGPDGGVLAMTKGEWVEIRVEIDLDNDTQSVYYGSDLLFTGSWKDGMSGGGIPNIANVDLYANTATVVYYDDISLEPAFNPECGVFGDIPWLSTNPTTGTTPAGGSSPVDVMFDASGLSVGVYTATLCAESNDPVTPILPIPVAMTVVSPEADLGVVKSAIPSEVKVGEMITYTLDVTNYGPQTALNVMLVDTLPALVTFSSASLGCSEEAGVVTCDIGDLAMDETVTLSIVVTANNVGTATNTAEVSSDIFDPDLINNTATADTIINPAFIYFYLPFIQKP